MLRNLAKMQNNSTKMRCNMFFCLAICYLIIANGNPLFSRNLILLHIAKTFQHRKPTFSQLTFWLEHAAQPL